MPRARRPFEQTARSSNFNVRFPVADTHGKRGISNRNFFNICRRSIARTRILARRVQIKLVEAQTARGCIATLAQLPEATCGSSDTLNVQTTEWVILNPFVNSVELLRRNAALREDWGNRFSNVQSEL